jgi:hypothetical protein
VNAVECRVLTTINSMDFILLSTYDSCCTIQLLCNMLFPSYFPLQLPGNEPFFSLDQWYMSDQVSGVSEILCCEYFQVEVRHIHCLWVNHPLTSSLMVIQVYQLNVYHNRLGQSQPTGGSLLSGTSPSFRGIGWYCWQWDSSMFSSNFVLWQIIHLMWLWRVWTIFKTWSANTCLDKSWWCFKGRYSAPRILVRNWGNSSFCITSTAASHHSKYGRMVTWSHLMISCLCYPEYIYYIAPKNHVKYLLKIVSWDEMVSFLISIITMIGLILRYCSIVSYILPLSLWAADNEGTLS